MDTKNVTNVQIDIFGNNDNLTRLVYICSFINYNACNFYFD